MSKILLGYGLAVISRISWQEMKKELVVPLRQLFKT